MFPVEPLSVSEDQAQELWNALAINVKGSAERIWRDMFLDSHVPVQRSTLSNIARISHRLMLLWLEVILYQDRAYSNFEARITEDGGATHAASESTRRGIHKHIKSYHETIRQWDKELTAAMKRYLAARKRRPISSRIISSLNNCTASLGSFRILARKTGVGLTDH